MYPAAAGVGSSLQYLKKFPEYQNNQLLILAGLEMTIVDLATLDFVST
jgi:hypothetical protein